MARAFSTLEGIGLSIDEDYAIVQECYPYLARRLFTDRSPRAEAALRAMLGLGAGAPTFPTADMMGVVVPTALPGALGGGGSSGFSPGKLIEMSEQFATSTATTTSVDQSGAGQAEAARELANLILTPEGSTLQDILVEEVVVGLDAATRQALRQALIETPSSFVGQFGLEAPAALTQLLAPAPEDERVLGTARELSELLSPRVRQQLDTATATPPSAPEVADAVGSTVGALLSDEDGARGNAAQTLEGISVLSRRIGAGLLRRAAARATSAADLPDAARDALANANTALADAIEPAAPQQGKTE